MEAEYMALAHAAKEAIWFRSLLTGIRITVSKPIVIYTDNQAAIALANDNQFHARSKHIDIRHHFVRDRIVSEDIALIHCASADNYADFLTKSLPLPSFKAQRLRLGIAAS